MSRTRQLVCSALFALLLIVLLPVATHAQSSTPAQTAEQIRTTLLHVQLDLASDATAAQPQLASAHESYHSGLSGEIQRAAPAADERVQSGFAAAQRALDTADAPAFAAARAQIWTALLAGSYTVVTQAITQHDGSTAKTWLPLREFRHATRVSRPNADATLAVNGFVAGTLNADAALAAVNADLLDAYQARLGEVLRDLVTPPGQSFAAKRTEQAGLAAGYFGILALTFEQQRGAVARTAVQGDLDALAQTARTSDATVPVIAARIAQALDGFRAAPLTDADRINRASKINRYLSLIAPNYGRGVRDGEITNQLEVDEARTFRDAVDEALTDLLPDLQARDAQRSAQLKTDLATLRDQIAQTDAPEAVQATADSATAHFSALAPAEWLQTNPSADFDAIRDLLTQVNKAVAARQYPQAESARLEAYSILDAGPEIRLRALAPNQANALSGLFWQGSDTLPGLANLLADRADAVAVQTTTAEIDKLLTNAQTTVGSGNATPAAVIGNAAVIIFRQGLEAVVILASIFAGLRNAEDRRFRRPLVLGALSAGVASIATWFALRAVITQFAAFGGRLEAVVSMIAVAVLLLILNWFFHNIYWVGWLSGIQKRKKRGLLSATAGQFFALALVGFTSVYREGFETALFAQVLVLEAGPAIVIQGLLLGAIPVVLIGLITFAVQAKLPYKTLLIVSGMLIGSVLIQMMGQTLHAMQAVRWMSVTPVHGLNVPYWMGVWFGIYPTWEGLLAQFGAAAIVLGSYFVAERQQHKKRVGATAPATTQRAPRKITR